MIHKSNSITVSLYHISDEELAHQMQNSMGYHPPCLCLCWIHCIMQSFLFFSFSIVLAILSLLPLYLNHRRMSLLISINVFLRQSKTYLFEYLCRISLLYVGRMSYNITLKIKQKIVVNDYSFLFPTIL